MNKKITFLMTAMALILAIMGPRNVAWGQTESVTYVFNSKDWKAKIGDTDANWTSKKDGNQFTANQGIQVTTGTTGACGNSNVSYSNVTKIIVTYCTNATKGAGIINWYNVEATNSDSQSGTLAGSYTVTKPSSNGTTLKTCEITPSSAQTGFVQLYVECSANSIYIWSVEIQYTSGPSTTPTCTIDPTEWDFGNVEIGEQAQKTFTVTTANLTEDLTLAVSEGFSVNPATIYSTETETTVTVTCAPTAVGALNGTLTISGGGLTDDVTATLTATGLCTAPTTALSYTTPVELQLTAGEAEATLAPIANTGNGGTITYELIAGDESHLSLDESTGEIYTDAIGSYTVRATQAVNGTICGGTFDIVINVTSTSPSCSVSPSEWDFGNVAIGTPASKTFTVTTANLTGDLTVSLYMGETTYSVTPTTIPQSATSTDVTVTFTPAEDGLIEELLTISGGGLTSAVEVELSATGISPYTINYMVNGVNTNPQVNVVPGTPLVFPEVSAPDNDHVFCGWVTTAIEGTQPTAPEYVNTEGLTAQNYATYYAVFAEKSGTGETTYTKLSSNSFESSATYVLAAEESASSSTLHYFSSYTTTTANESWGVTSTTATDAITFTLSGTASALVAQDASGNYLTPLATGKFRMSSTSQTLNLNDDGTIYNPTSGNTGYRLRYNHNNGSGGFRWYNGTTGTSAYFYKAETEIIYSNYCTTIVAKDLTSLSLSGEYPTEFWKGDAFSHEGMTVTAHYSNAPDADVTASATFTGYDMSTAGGQTVTVTYETQSTTYGITVKTIANTQATAYTVAEAKAIIDANPAELATTEVYVQGIICQIDSYNSQYNSITYWISTDGTQDNMFEVYSGKNLNNTNFTSISDIVLQADVIIYGNIKKFNSTYEFDKNNYLVSYTVPQSYTITLNQSTGGTISADKQTAAEGETVTITIEPASGYTLATLTGATFNETVDPELFTYTFTMPAEEVTISATFNAVPTYTISFTTNGVDETATIVINQGAEIGSTLPEPTAANVPNGYTFRGWSAGDVALTDVEPTYVTAETIPTGDMTLKAVFAMGETSGENALVKMVAGNTLNNGDKIVIVAHETTVALYQETVSSSYVNKYTFDNNFATIMGDDKNWLTVSTAEGGFTLGDATNGYLYSSGNNLYIGGTAQTWTLLDLANGTFKIQSDGRNLSYRHDLTNQYWRMGGASYGTSGQTVLGIYKISTSSTTYSNFCTTVSSPEISAEISGNVTIPSGAAYTLTSSITIKSGATLTVNGVLGNADASLLVIEDGGQLICGNEVSATVRKSISGYTVASGEGANGWYIVSAPITDATASMAATGTYDLYTHDEAHYMWRNYEVAANQTTYDWFTSGYGYLYANADNTTLQFAGTVAAEGQKEVNLTCAANDATHGWNLLGNHTTHSIFFTGNNIEDGYYVMNAAGNAYESRLTSVPVAPCEGFFVKATSNTTVTLNPQPVSKSEEETPAIIETRVTETANANYSDVAYIVKGHGNNLTKISFGETTPSLFFAENGKDYAITHISDETEALPLYFKASANANYTLNFNIDGEEFDYVVLNDMKTGAQIDLLENSSYSFDATTEDDENRFNIVFVASATESISENMDQPFAYRSGNEFIISSNGTLQIIDALGHVISTQAISGSARVNVGNLTQGTYIMRLIGDNTVRTQKIVVK